MQASSLPGLREIQDRLAGVTTVSSDDELAALCENARILSESWGPQVKDAPTAAAQAEIFGNVKTLITSCANQVVVARLSRAIYFLARSFAIRTCATELAASLVSALRTGIEWNSSTTTDLCDALSNLCVAPECQVAVAAAGGIPVLLSVLERCSADPSVSEAACCALQNLAEHPSNQAAIGRAGGVATITSVLARHATSAAVTGAACGALRNLADCAENVPRLVSVSAAALLASALYSHFSDAVVVEAACGALESLAEGGQRRMLLAIGIIPSIVSALHVNIPLPQGTAVLQPLCSLLATVADFGRGKGAPPHDGCVPLLACVVRGMAVGAPAGSPAQLAAWRSLWHLARLNSNRLVIFDAGLLPDMLASLRIRAIAPAVIATLNNVSLNATARATILKPESALAVAATLREFGADDVRTASSALSTLWGACRAHLASVPLVVFLNSCAHFLQTGSAAAAKNLSSRR